MLEVIIAITLAEACLAVYAVRFAVNQIKVDVSRKITDLRHDMERGWREVNEAKVPEQISQFEAERRIVAILEAFEQSNNLRVEGIAVQEFIGLDDEPGTRRVYIETKSRKWVS